MHFTKKNIEYHQDNPLKLRRVNLFVSTSLSMRSYTKRLYAFVLHKPSLFTSLFV